MFRFGIPLLVVVSCVLFFSNPSHETHKKVVVQRVTGEATNNSLLGSIAAGLAERFSVPLDYHNYYLFSTTTANGQTRSFGCFSQVWVWDGKVPTPPLPGQPEAGR